jgi:hypothetical protein
MIRCWGSLQGSTPNSTLVRAVRGDDRPPTSKSRAGYIRPSTRLTYVHFTFFISWSFLQKNPKKHNVRLRRGASPSTCSWHTKGLVCRCGAMYAACVSSTATFEEPMLCPEARLSPSLPNAVG